MRRRLILWLSACVLLPLTLVGVLLLGAWGWTAHDSSLSTMLQWVSRFLPADQTLTADGVSGTLRSGGHIERLRWTKNGLVVDAQKIDVVWQPYALLNRTLRVDHLQVAKLHIDDQSPASETRPLTELPLPLQVDLKFKVDALLWAEPNSAESNYPTGMANLLGSYQFDGTQHNLQVANANLAAGQYRAQATLLARAPATLNIQVQGQVAVPVPGNTTNLSLAAAASVQGQLTGLDTVLKVSGALVPEPVSGASTVANAMKAQVLAQIKPWAAQPVLDASADFSGINLAALWPAAPQTHLTGSVSVQPDLPATALGKATGKATASVWQAQVKLTNGASGPWDLGRLPLDSANARLAYQRGQWLVQSLAINLAGGKLTAEGGFTVAPSSEGQSSVLAGWRTQAKLLNIDPANLHSKLATSRVGGQIMANGVGSLSSVGVGAGGAQQTLAFDAQLTSDRPATQEPTALSNAKRPLPIKSKGLLFNTASARGEWLGNWHDGKLRLDALLLKMGDALLEAQLDINPSGKGASGHLQLMAPGGRVSLKGDISPIRGEGDFAVQVDDVAQVKRWLETLPGVPQTWAEHHLHGRADVKGRWVGGWQNTGLPAVGLRLQSAWRVPLMVWAQPLQKATDSFTFSDIEADLSGSVSALSLKASGQLDQGGNRFNGQTLFTDGKLSEGVWTGLVRDLRLQLSSTHQTPTRGANSAPTVWSAQIKRATRLTFKQDARSKVTSSTFEADGTEFDLKGPGSALAVVTLKPTYWHHSDTLNEIKSAGELTGLPMAWIEQLADNALTNNGLRGDLIFDGDWELLTGSKLTARATLARRSGDIRLAIGNDAGLEASAADTTVSAGIKAASLVVTTDGKKINAIAHWDSTRAGAAQGQFTTEFIHDTHGWQWPDDAPITGTLRAQLPQLGVWSTLAPPGWRVVGTLDANVAVAGTRIAPQWRGNLNADNLALRSVADGIEFSNGKLRSTLNGARLDIDTFTLQGATGSHSLGGQLSAKGVARWLSKGRASVAQQPRIQLEMDLLAESLRVSARADRRLSVSGKLQIMLEDAALRVRGALKADQALFLLPDETTPSLGSDVVVKLPGKSRPLLAIKPESELAKTLPARTIPDVDVSFDMGPDFKIQGRGLSARLAGTLNLSSSAATLGTPQLIGTLYTVGGRYKAYGQQLDVESGVLRFNGPYDNPSLNVLALRPNLSVTVGVQGSGTALLPRVRLYSEPDLPDAEKLAWLVLGRSAANGGAESAALQQAALALMGRNGKGLVGGFTEAIGLDELSYRGSATNADGSTSAAAVTLGKRISRNFYVAYEHSVAGTLGTVYIFYDLSKRFSLRAQTGEQSAIDLIFTVPYD